MSMLVLFMMMMMMIMMILAMVVPSLSSPSFLVRSAWNWMNSNFFSQLDTAGTVTMLVMKKLIVTVTIVVVVKLVML